MDAQAPGETLYRKILERLSGDLNGTRFEECACALLTDAIPSLAPIPGGSDDGADGSFVEDGRQGILIATVQDDVPANVRKSLGRWLETGHPPCLVAVATSQPLNQKRIKSIRAEVEGLGFVWFNHYDRQALAERLRKNAFWRQRLLGLGSPARALAVEPLSQRPVIDLKLIGRDADLEWLRNVTGDAILFGEPGSGKTYLLRELARTNWGLFVVNPDLGMITDDLLELEPRRLIVDDAHNDPGLLTRLEQMRRADGHEFQLIATTWPGEEPSVRQALSTVSPTAVRRLELLNREQIVQIYREADLTTDNQVLSHLTDLAAGKPGLAATIVQLWKATEPGASLHVEDIVKHLFDGLEALVREKRVNEVLSSLALGGSAGMDLAVVAKFLRLDLAFAHHMVSDLAAAGVLRDCGGGRLAVVPPDLRRVRVKQTFLSGVKLDFRPLLDAAPSYESALLTLLGAVALGGSLLDSELLPLVSRTSSPRVWTRLAALSSDHARWALEAYSGSPKDIAAAALARAPGDAIRVLLRHDSSTESESISEASRQQHPIRVWLSEKQTAKQAVERRQLTVETASKALAEGGHRAVVRMYLLWAMSPALAFTETDPGLGRTATIHFGSLGGGTIREFARLWQSVESVLKPFRLEDWPDLASSLRHWLDPEMDSPGQEQSADDRIAKNDIARSIVAGIAGAFVWSPGLASILVECAGKAEVHVDVAPEPEFELLYPNVERWHDDYEAREREYRDAVGRLAPVWAHRPPGEAFERLARYAAEARTIMRNSPDYSRALVEGVAAIIDNPEEWIAVLVSAGHAAEHAVPFLRRLAATKSREGTALLLRAIRDERYRRASVLALLPLTLEDERLLAELEAACAQEPEIVETAALRREIPPTFLRRLLESGADSAAQAAAVGLLSGRAEHPSISHELETSAKKVIIRTQPSAITLGGPAAFLRHGFAAILARDRYLAEAWAREHIQHLATQSLADLDERDLEKILRSFDHGQRLDLVRLLPPSTDDSHLVCHLVAGDPDAFSELLARSELRRVHFTPFCLESSRLSPEMPRRALDADYSPKEVARGVMENRIWSGWGSDGVEKEVGPMVLALENSSDARLNEVARRIQEIATSLDQGFRQLDRSAELHGADQD